MSKKLTKIDFGFENCEVGILPIRAVPYFNLKHIQKDYRHNWGWEEEPDDEFSCSVHCEKACFKIDYELASEVKTNFMNFDDSDTDESNLAQRFLDWTNLSSVTLRYDDGSEEFIWLPYEEQNEGEFFNTANKLQSTEVVRDDPWKVGINKAYKNHKIIIINIDKN